jgi:hypothetical protein
MGSARAAAFCSGANAAHKVKRSFQIEGGASGCFVSRFLRAGWHEWLLTRTLFWSRRLRKCLELKRREAKRLPERKCEIGGTRTMGSFGHDVCGANRAILKSNLGLPHYHGQMWVMIRPDVLKLS